jgi:spore germination cell wall hydrolase CwlJ-like protein
MQSNLRSSWNVQQATCWTKISQGAIRLAQVAIIAAGTVLAAGQAQAQEAQSPRWTEDQVRCLALNVYHEARNQSFDGQLAVAHVTLNRVDDPRFPKTICRVVYQTKSFSWTINRGRLSPPREREAWQRALQVARMAIEDRDGDPTFGSTHYHLASIKPYWAEQKKLVAKIDGHVFYRWERG